MDVAIRPMTEDDLPAVDVVFRLAFGTLAGLPEPIKYGGDTDYVSTRWQTDPSASFVAVSDGKPVGSVFLTHRGSVAILGPLTVHPNVWHRAIGTRLLEPAMRLLDQWGPSHTGLFTVVHSPKHMRLYRKFGFWPRCLVEIMSKPIEKTRTDPDMKLLSQLSTTRRDDALARCRRLTESLYNGLDVTREIQAAQSLDLGDTALFYDGGDIRGFAVCHWGPGTEAGSGKCYIKFAAVEKGPDAGKLFERLLGSCEVLAAGRGAATMVAGVNTARSQACERMIIHGFHTQTVGVAMHRPYKPAYNRDEIHVIDDWR